MCKPEQSHKKDKPEKYQSFHSSKCVRHYLELQELKKTLMMSVRDESEKAQLKK